MIAEWSHLALVLALPLVGLQLGGDDLRWRSEGVELPGQRQHDQQHGPGGEDGTKADPEQPTTDAGASH